MTTEVLKEYLGMIADLERDLYEYLKIEASIDKKLRESYVLPVERSLKNIVKTISMIRLLRHFQAKKRRRSHLNPDERTFRARIFVHRQV